MEAMVDKIRRLESQLGIPQEVGAAPSPILDIRVGSGREATSVRDKQPSPDAEPNRMEPQNGGLDNSLQNRLQDGPSHRITTNGGESGITGLPVDPALPSPIRSNFRDENLLPTHREPHRQASPIDVNHRARNAQVPEVSRAPSLADHHAALMLEDLAFDRTNNVERQSPGPSEYEFQRSNLVPNLVQRQRRPTPWQPALRMLAAETSHVNSRGCTHLAISPCPIFTNFRTS